MSERHPASIQERIVAWVRTRFGVRVLMDRHERARRVVEEAIELAQAEHLSKESLGYILDRVYSRPVGHPNSEAAGVGLTLAAWAWAAGRNLEDLMGRELDRIEAIDPKVSRAKHEEKVRDGSSVLPAGP